MSCIDRSHEHPEGMTGVPYTGECWSIRSCSPSQRACCLYPFPLLVPSHASKPTPEGVAGYDVNRGCKPSYIGDDVSGENFLAVLKGDNDTTRAFIQDGQQRLVQ